MLFSWNEDILDIIENFILKKISFCPLFPLVSANINKKYKKHWENFMLNSFFWKIKKDWNIFIKNSYINIFKEEPNLVCMISNYWTLMAIKYITEKLFLGKLGCNYLSSHSINMYQISMLGSDKKIKQLLLRDINQDLRNKENNMYVIIPSNTKHRLIGIFMGPPNTPYSGGLFLVNLIISENIAISTKVSFITKIYHPNIYNNDIFIDILMHNWSPLYRLQPRLILLSIQSILCIPEFSDCHDYLNDNTFNEEQKNNITEYKNQYNIYEKKARDYTIKYANYSVEDIYKYL